jgi:hypothetical protein
MNDGVLKNLKVNDKTLTMPILNKLFKETGKYGTAMPTFLIPTVKPVRWWYPPDRKKAKLMTRFIRHKLGVK